MRVRVTNPLDDQTIGLGEFDEEWKRLGERIKFALQTYDERTTWLNMHISHDGQQSHWRTIEVIEK